MNKRPTFNSVYALMQDIDYLLKNFDFTKEQYGEIHDDLADLLVRINLFLE